MEVEESKTPTKRKPVKTASKEDEKKPPSSAVKAKEVKSRLASAKIEKDMKKKNEKEADSKEEEDMDDVSLAIPAILNFINGYFLSKTPQSMDLAEYRHKRIERRKKLEDKLKKVKSIQKESSLKEKKPEDSIEGFDTDRFVKEDTLVDDSGKPLVCSYARTQKNYESQPWYMCNTCGLNNNEGVCTVCAKTCHKDHELIFCKTSSFFCDCQFKFDCVSLPDQYKEAKNKNSNRLGFPDFNYESPFSSEPPWRRSDGSGRGRGSYGDFYYRGMRGDRGGRGGRGRGDRGGRRKRSSEREQIEALRKSKKRHAKAQKMKKSTHSGIASSSWDQFGAKPGLFADSSGLVGKYTKKGAPPSKTRVRRDSSSDSEGDSSVDISDSDEVDDFVFERMPDQVINDDGSRNMKAFGDHAIDDMYAEEEELILHEDMMEDEFIMNQIKQKGLLEGNDPKKIQMLEEILAKSNKRARNIKGKSAPEPDDDDDGEGENDDEEEGEEEEDEPLEEEKKEFVEEEFKEPRQVDQKEAQESYQDSSFAGGILQDSSCMEEEDKKMDDIEEDSKSISSMDIKTDPPKLAEDGKELEPIGEENEEMDIDMEDDYNEDFLNDYNRTYELFRK